MDEPVGGVTTPQAPSARAEQSKGVWALGWLTILWSALQLLWFFLWTWASSASQQPSAGTWNNYGLQQYLGQEDTQFAMRTMTLSAAAYFLTGIGWIRARGWAHRALIQSTIAGIAASFVALLLNALANGPDLAKFAMMGFGLIVPVVVLAYARQRQVRQQFDTPTSQGALMALALSLLVFGGSASPSIRQYLLDRKADQAAPLTIWERLPDQTVRGRYVVLSFWASWCGPCKAVIPKLQGLQKRMAGRNDITIVGVNLDNDRKAMERFARRHGMTWPHVFDGKGWGTPLAKTYHVDGIPHETLLGPDGSVILEEGTIEEIEAKLKSLPSAAGFSSQEAPAAPTAKPATTLRPLPMPAASTGVKGAVGIDMYHGSGWNGLVETIQENSWGLSILEAPITLAALKPLNVLIVHQPRKDYSADEIQAIKQFVADGGGLLCAELGWSWISYDKKPIEVLPSNQIGREMNFWIFGTNGGAVKFWDTKFMKGITEIKQERWIPSPIELKGEGAVPLVRDEGLHIVGGTMPFGKGQIILYGHGGILQENAAILVRSIQFLIKAQERNRQ